MSQFLTDTTKRPIELNGAIARHRPLPITHAKWIPLAAALIVAALDSTIQANAHDAKASHDQTMGDPRRAQWFKSLKTEFGGSCCNLTDCQQTRAKQLADRSWIAVVTDWRGPRWVLIPPKKVLKNPKSIDGEAYVCNSQGAPAHSEYFSGSGRYAVPDREGMIFCFVPPIPGY